METRRDTTVAMRLSSMAESLMRIITHPVGLGLAIMVSIILWMPFGMGYYGYPWEVDSARWKLSLLVKAFPYWATTACLLSLFPRERPLRFFVAAAALCISLFGVKTMTDWIPRYLEHIENVERVKTSAE